MSTSKLPHCQGQSKWFFLTVTPPQTTNKVSPTATHQESTLLKCRDNFNDMGHGPSVYYRKTGWQVQKLKVYFRTWYSLYQGNTCFLTGLTRGISKLSCTVTYRWNGGTLCRPAKCDATLTCHHERLPVGHSKHI